MYKFKFHEEAEKELGKLNKTIQVLFTKKLKQILENPEIGKELGNKANLDLTGLKKVYFDNKRDNLTVYKKASEQI